MFASEAHSLYRNLLIVTSDWKHPNCWFIIKHVICYKWLKAHNLGLQGNMFIVPSDYFTITLFILYPITSSNWRATPVSSFCTVTYLYHPLVHVDPADPVDLKEIKLFFCKKGFVYNIYILTQVICLSIIIGSCILFLDCCYFIPNKVCTIRYFDIFIKYY